MRLRKLRLSTPRADVLVILKRHTPIASQLLIDRLEYLLARDDQLAYDIADARHELRRTAS